MLLKCPKDRSVNNGALLWGGWLLPRPNTTVLYFLSIDPICPVLVCQSQRLVPVPSGTSSVSRQDPSWLRGTAVASIRDPPGNSRLLPPRHREFQSPVNHVSHFPTLVVRRLSIHLFQGTSVLRGQLIDHVQISLDRRGCILLSSLSCFGQKTRREADRLLQCIQRCRQIQGFRRPFTGVSTHCLSARFDKRTRSYLWTTPPHTQRPHRKRSRPFCDYKCL